ncbi:S-adenosyl-L-methionine-dependent methyltransferase [Jimgerdemannia flammicorona]|uniref:S-adenosyl-L-methionine-dependent methyltransferase n=1 Tax=Jimgerdemannia flammicorona TaxID=994334 RepID=A0A433D8V7_9FUNG|nr:S-adenosyl-L-methionine-dependent methyltransferase [Jimgerdemannia flammicorona]
MPKQNNLSSNGSTISHAPEGFKVIDGCMRFNMHAEDTIHYVLRHIMHGNFSAPMEEDLVEGIKVLDVGCGTGIWTLEMAREFPNSIFVGTDKFKVEPMSDNIPPNATFLTADTLQGLPFEDGSFDYVFQRGMSISFRPKDWDIAMKELTRLTKPGGFLELFEIDLKNIERPPEDMTAIDKGEYLTLNSGYGHTLHLERKHHQRFPL